MAYIAFAALTGWCAALSLNDLRHRRLPNALTGWGALAVFGYALFTTQFTTAVVGAVLLAAPYAVVHLVAPLCLGAGDAKLAVGLGAATALGGAQAWVWAALAAPVLTAGVGLAMLVRHRISAGARVRPNTVAHGPSMCLATLFALAAPSG
ncbi:prepilin peptidase [Nocardia amikacinitolerans]|uniref:prepilin peptidase n=1 Tax=Nocardia amikacinitolerans TaxID=756689 RepID=UPI0020A2570F|nr:A24 family peptidase [Nocardia amikacinitolerans]MCP2287929.1 leader peptidase (prepilin peptidase) / N-methyltransferase [Nocardia amikacinitolerans]